jgi:hypothetical protein
MQNTNAHQGKRDICFSFVSPTHIYCVLLMMLDPNRASSQHIEELLSWVNGLALEGLIG